MAAYAALVSIMQTIHQIEHHPSPPISMDKKQVESLTHIVMFLQEFLEGYKSPFADSDEPDPLEMRIADAVCAAEDAIESHIVDQILAAGSFGLSDSARVCDDLSREIRAMDYIVSVKGELLRQVGSSTSAGLFKTEVGLIEATVIQDMDLIVAIKGWLQRQVSTSADLYEGLVKVIEHMDFIKKEVQHIIVLNHKLMRLVIKSPGLYKSLVKEIGNMNFSSVLKDKLQEQVSTSADLYESVVQMVEGMHLFMKEVKEIVALKDQLLRLVGFSTLEDLDNSMVKMKEHMVDMDLTKKEVMEIVVKDRLHRQVSVSAELHESLQKVIEEMDLIKKQVTEIVAVKDQSQVSESGGSSKSSKMLRNNSLTSSLSRVMNSTAMVGFDDIMLQLMERLIYGEPGRHVIPIVGMGGIGKTTLAKNVYAHPSISHHFDIYAWVTISQQYNTKEILCEILSQSGKQGLSQMSEEDEIVALHKCLTHRRYLVVLDDMWSIEAWNMIQRYLPDNRNGSRIVVTTRLSNLGSQLDNSNGLEMKLMNEESSWNVFCKIVFCGKSCPSELEKIGKKIVKCCRGLPLSIVVMGGLVAKLEQTKESWKSIRRSLNSLVNSEDDNHCLKILKLSYTHLPVYLKPCFLYLGMFEEDSKIRVSRIIELLVSEGFLKPISGKNLETVAKEYLDELVDRNLILVHELGSTGNMKYCKIHDLFRDLCLREAQKERFYDVVGQHSHQGTCIQRRVAIMGSTSEEKVVDAMKSRPYVRTCISDRERVQLLPYLKLLRTLRLCDDDNFAKYSLGKLFKLVNLRLLVVRSYGHSSQVPSSMNLLWSLQTLIVSTPRKEVNAPVEIWNMSQLRHVKFRSAHGHLPDPPSDNIVIMENLHTLKGVKNFKCDEMMVHRIPNIKKLGLHFYEDTGIESRDDHFCAHNIERLQRLECLSCHGFPSGDFLRKLTFPHSLKSLTLFMSIYRMEDILEKVSTLPLLQKLKLRGGYFTTGKWETVEDQFRSLKFFSLGYNNLECWMMESSHFPCLEHLHLCNMKDLKEIPAELGEISTLKSVVLDCCSESAVKSAKRMVEEQEELQGEEQLSFHVTVHLCYGEDDMLSLATPNLKVF